MNTKFFGMVGIALAACLATAAVAASKLGPGDTLPPQLGFDLKGDATESAPFAGKVVIVAFWATWCTPCRWELTMLEGLQKVAGKEQLQVVAINTEDRGTFIRAARALKVASILITHDFGETASDAFGVRGLPHSVIVGRDGKIINVHVGYGERAFDTMLAEINAALAANK